MEGFFGVYILGWGGGGGGERGERGRWQGDGRAGLGRKVRG